MYLRPTGMSGSRTKQTPYVVSLDAMIYLLITQLAGRLDDVICALYIPTKCPAVRDNRIASIGHD